MTASVRIGALVAIMMVFAAGAAAATPAKGTRLRYAAISASSEGTRPPFAAVHITYGPAEQVDGKPYVWWELRIDQKDEANSPPVCVIQALTSADPLAPRKSPMRFQRYLLRLPATDETLEYRDVHTGAAALPAWKDFQKWFIPARARSAKMSDIPETATLLGQVLSLRQVEDGVAWSPLDAVKRLELDPELLVGTGRYVKDSEGHRLPPGSKQDYTYVPFTREDYRTMIDAGCNLFTVPAERVSWVRDEPVFFVAPADASHYPADLYRANYSGPVEFTDEPWSLVGADQIARPQIRSFADATALLSARVRSEYRSPGRSGPNALADKLRSSGVNLGEMELSQWDIPIWETHFATTYYQLSAGGSGLIHEGRYQLASFDAAVAKWTKQPRKHTPEQMLRYHYAFLRGGARQTGKDWGTSIYGQTDPELAPQAVTLAYDMGARYVWFWTSDHGHHVPWIEQVALAKKLKDHVAAHPRPSIRQPAAVIDKAIVVPYGYFLELAEPWWLTGQDAAQGDARQRYASLMRRAHEAIHAAMDQHEDYDVVVDNATPIHGYRTEIRLTDEP